MHLWQDGLKIRKPPIRAQFLEIMQQISAASQSKHPARLEHLEIELFEGPFTRNDLLLLFRNWTKSLKHLLITFHFDKGKYLNRWVNELYFPGDSPNPLLVLNSGFRTDARS